LAGIAAVTIAPAAATLTTSTPVAAATPNLNSPLPGFGSLGNVVIHNLYMDYNWDADNPSTLSRATLDDFTTQLVNTGYFTKATQYGVPSATYTGSDQAIAACPPPGGTFSFGQLSYWILCEQHYLPSSSTSGVNLWMVYAPVSAGVNISIQWPWGNNTPIMQTCQPASAPMDGFHSQTLPQAWSPFDITSPQTFGIVFPGCPMMQGQNATGILNATTEAASHELIEAATDPLVPTGWYDRALSGPTGEAGDLCEPDNSFGAAPTSGWIWSHSYEISSYWSDADGACVAPGDGSLKPPPPIYKVVPNVMWDTAIVAKAILNRAGFNVTISPVADPTCTSTGIVLGQSPTAGSSWNIYQAVTIDVGARPKTPCP
jgi:hypothetical protein